MMKYAIIITLGLIAYSCNTPKPLYDWTGYDDAVYNYTKNADEKSIQNLTNIYIKLMKNSGGTRETPPPGVCADYGYLLIKAGEIKKGRELLEKETQLYPASKQFIDRILKRFEE